MPRLETRSHPTPKAKTAVPRKTGTRTTRATAKARVARKLAGPKRGPGGRSHAKVAAKRKVAPVRQVILPHPDQTAIILGPHHVDRHLIPSAFHVHPPPVMHPVGPLAMKHPRVTLRHH